MGANASVQRPRWLRPRGGKPGVGSEQGAIGTQSMSALDEHPIDDHRDVGTGSGTDARAPKRLA